MMEIPSYIQKILTTLEMAGFEAYIVGGCVRDHLLGKIPVDYDITTNALPDKIIELFNQYHIIKSGLKHGTVGIVIEKKLVEITTYRIDGEYLDNRRPKSVYFTSNLKLDLKRRDFTINAMAYNIKTGIVDYYNGEVDLNNKKIRCVGSADDRFKEDALRILRALRFASKLSFEIEEKTSNAIIKNCFLLNNIAQERINTEFFKLMLGNNCLLILSNYQIVFETIFKKKYTKNNLILNQINNAPKKLNIRLAILFYSMDLKKEERNSFLKKMKYSNQLINDIKFLLENYDLIIIDEDKQLKWLLNRFGLSRTIDLITLRTIVDDKNDYNSILIKIGIIINTNQCYSLKQLAINGADLIEAGYPSNKKIKDILNFCLELVINDNAMNKKEKLLTKIKAQFLLK